MADGRQPADARTDVELVAAANTGNRGAFDELYLRHRQWVVSAAMRYTRSRDDALDVMQEVFLYFFGKFPGFELSARLRTFLYPAVRSLSLNLLRKRRRELAALSAAEHGPAETDLPAPDAQRAAVAAVVARLPDDQREIVMLRYVDGMKLSEIARAMNMPLGTVKSALHRALATLRSSLPRP